MIATGSLSDPYLHGFVRLEEGGARFPRPAPPLEALRARIELGGRRHQLELGALLGREEATLAGEVGMRGLRPDSIALSLGGRNLLLASGRDLRARSDVDLRLPGKPGALRLSGDLHLRRVRFYRDFESGGAEGGGAPGKGVVAGLGPIELDVRIESEDEVWIDNRETLSRYRIEGELAGTLDRPRLRGTVQCIRGVYRHYGRTFRIESALLDFDGEDLGNPRVDIVNRKLEEAPFPWAG